VAQDVRGDLLLGEGRAG